VTADQWAAAANDRPPKRKATSIGLFLGIIVVIGIGTAGLVQVLTPPPPDPPCVSGRACSGPPAPSGGVPVDGGVPAPPSHVPVSGPDDAPAMTTGTAWRSPDLGFGVDYDPDGWSVVDQDRRGALLGGVGQLRDASLWIAATPAADASPDRALAARVSALGESLVGLAEDDRPESRILGPNIGYVDGVGAVYGGATDSAQGPGRRARVAVLSASDGNLTITASLILVGGTADDWQGVRQAADSVLNTTTWSATAAAPGGVTSGPSPTVGDVSRADPPAATVDLGAPDPDATIELTLALLPRDPDGLAAYAAGIVDPASPDYGRALSPDTIGDRFGPSPAALERLANGLREGGLRIVGRTPQRTTLRVRGAIRSVEALFATHIKRFSDQDGRTYLAPTTAPLIPAAFADTVDGVLGLDGSLRARPAFGWDAPIGNALLPGAAAPQFGLRPGDVAAAYDIAPLHGAGLDGTGQTVAIVSFDAIDDATIAAFDREVGTSGSRVVHVRVNGGTEPGDGSSEVALDIEVIRSVAPKARIIDFEAPNDGTAFADVVDAIVADGRARTISISWGQCDDPGIVPTADRRADERSFQAAVAAGYTIFSATGDFAAYDCRGNHPEDLDLITDWPSGSQYVVAVGGTRLSVRTSGGYLAEEGWEDTLEGSGGGGGIAVREPRPSWQKDVATDLAGAADHRVVPDVAAAADPDSGFYAVWRDSDDSLVQGSIGGTSAATPFWAGSTLLVRQAAAKAGKQPPGFLAPLLYQVAGSDSSGAFHDVVRGGNLGYDAGPGWDAATGLGSPDVARLLNAIVDALP
jgi:Pro-kumamolisin, activation domain/Subtilase family